MKSDWKSIFYTWNKNKSVCPLYERVVQLVGCWGYQGEMREREKQEKLQGRQRWGEQDVANVRYIVGRERSEQSAFRTPSFVPCLRRPRYFISIRHYFLALLCALLT